MRNSTMVRSRFTLKQLKFSYFENNISYYEYRTNENYKKWNLFFCAQWDRRTKFNLSAIFVRLPIF